MKAIVYDQFGSPDVLHLTEVERPVPRDHEVLVKVCAASVNFSDPTFVSGKPFLVRLMGAGLLKPKIRILGADIAGRVEAVGRDVTRFKPGHEVFGDLSRCGWGGFAEYVCASENAIALKPPGATFEEAAALPQASCTALQGLRDTGQIESGQKILINGASGGIGTFAVQISKSFGAEVTGVCSTANLEMVRSIGADHVIDYTQEEFTQNGHRYDLILDIVANQSVSEYARALSATGTYVACAFNPTSLFLGPFISKKGGRKIVSLVAKPDPDGLLVISDLVEAGTVKPVIDKRYPLSNVPEAVRYYGTRHARGKVVITVR